MKTISFKSALTTVKKYSTGKKFRNMQMWSTRFECLKDGNYFMITIPDSQVKCVLHNEGSDL